MKILTSPTSTTLIDPAEVLERLRLPSGQLTAITRLAGRASALVAEALGFEPWYQRVQETFDAPLETLNLLGRPFVRLVSLGEADADALVVDEDFEICDTARRSGEVFLRFPSSSSSEYLSPAFVWPTLSWPSAPLIAEYWCGWWLPTMSGSRPTDVRTLPLDLIEATWLTCQWRYRRDQINPAIDEMSKGGSRISFVASSGPIPGEAMQIIERYRLISIP